MELSIEPTPEIQPVEKVKPLDVLEMKMFDLPQVECPVTHRFTPGLYIREIFMPAGVLITSAKHMTKHPFVISKGDVSVYVEGKEVARYKAPFTGITEPGTRRLLFIHEDTIWTTFHVTDKTDPIQIGQEILDETSNPLLSEAEIQQSAWRQATLQKEVA